MSAPQVERQKKSPKSIWVAEMLRRALSLEEEPLMFDLITETLCELADATFRFTKPVFPQKAALEEFVQMSGQVFPAYFGSCNENMQLLHHLQRYVANYVVEKSRHSPKHTRDAVQTTKRSTKPRTKKPLKSTFSTKSEIVGGVKYGPPKRRRTKESHMDAHGVGDSAVLNESQKPAMQDPQGSTHPMNNNDSTNTLPDDGPGPEAVKKFLEDCCPPMAHLFRALQDARITGEVHLDGMASLPEEEMRIFVKERLARTPLELETLARGFNHRKKSNV